MSNNLDFRSFLQLMVRRWRTIAVVTALAAVAAAIFSGPVFMKPLYRSTAAVYPVNLHSYSGESPTEQLLQLMQSNNIRDTLVERFRLDSLYEIDITKRGGPYWVHKELAGRLKISKTIYESVQVEIRDEDPFRARDMVQAVLDETNELALQLHRRRAREVLVIAEDAMRTEQQRVDSINAILDGLRRDAGLLSYDVQARELMRGMAQSIAMGAPRQRTDELHGMLRTMEEKGGEFRRLTELLDMRLEVYSELVDAYAKARVDVEKELTYIDVVVHPEAVEKKVWPVRWLIVLLSVISAAFLTVLLLVVREVRE